MSESVAGKSMFAVESILGMDSVVPLVKVQFNEYESTIDAATARSMAALLLDVAAASEADFLVFKLLTETYGFTVQASGQFILQLRELRGRESST